MGIMPVTPRTGSRFDSGLRGSPIPMRRLITSGGVIALLLVASISGGVVAQTEEENSLFEQLTGDDADEKTLGDRVDAVTAAVDGYLERAVYTAGSAQATLNGTSDVDRAQEYAADATEVYNAHNETIEQYTNKRVSVTVASWDTVAVEFGVGDATATRYLVSNAENGDFANSRMVNDTTREVDHTLRLDGYAAKNADKELSYFVEEYAAEDKDIDASLMTRMQAYAPNIELPEEVMN